MEGKTVLSVEDRVIIKKPKMYAVIMHNDDYTTMDFVVDVLIKVFLKSSVEAANIMMEIHNNGKSSVGIFTFDMAVTKKLRTEQMAEEKGFPLRITLEEAME